MTESGEVHTAEETSLEAELPCCTDNVLVVILETKVLSELLDRDNDATREGIVSVHDANEEHVTA